MVDFRQQTSYLNNECNCFKIFFLYLFILEIHHKLFKDPQSESDTYVGSDTEDEEEEEGHSDTNDSNGNPLRETVVTEGAAGKTDEEEALAVESTASGVDEHS